MLSHDCVCASTAWQASSGVMSSSPTPQYRSAIARKQQYHRQVAQKSAMENLNSPAAHCILSWSLLGKERCKVLLSSLATSSCVTRMERQSKGMPLARHGHCCVPRMASLPHLFHSLWRPFHEDSAWCPHAGSPGPETPALHVSSSFLSKVTMKSLSVLLHRMCSS